MVKSECGKCLGGSLSYYAFVHKEATKWVRIWIWNWIWNRVETSFYFSRRHRECRGCRRLNLRRCAMLGQLLSQLGIKPHISMHQSNYE